MPAPFAFSPPETATIVALVTAQETVFPDYWWEPGFWAKLRQAERKRAIINVVAPDPAFTELSRVRLDPARVVAELEALHRHTENPEYQARLAEAAIEANENPVAMNRVLFIGGGPNTLTNELFTALWTWPTDVVLHFKHKYKRPRPFQLDPTLRLGLDCPGHPAFPSGHSTQYHLAAEVLADVFQERTDLAAAFRTMADRVAVNREFAGLHYPSDTEGGKVLARLLKPFFIVEHLALINRVRQEEWSLPIAEAGPPTSPGALPTWVLHPRPPAWPFI